MRIKDYILEENVSIDFFTERFSRSSETMANIILSKLSKVKQNAISRQFFSGNMFIQYCHRVLLMVTFLRNISDSTTLKAKCSAAKHNLTTSVHSGSAHQTTI